MEIEWPYPHPPETVVFTTTPVMLEQDDIVYIYHGEDGWQVFGAHEVDADQIKLIRLDELDELDHTIRQISDLELGWEAWRIDRKSKWNKRLRPRD